MSKQGTFFELTYEANRKAHEPLAYRMRPKSLKDFCGQSQIIGSGRLLTRLIQADRLTSAIFYGPPGTGKTTLARIIAAQTKADFESINAVMAGKKDIETIIRKAKQTMSVTNRKTILFVDEIHRFNKAQQDALLPSVEAGIIVLIGATTENPYFEINPALISRSTLFEFVPLTKGDIRTILERALSDEENGYGLMSLQVEDEALDHFADVAAGDVRKALNALELAVLTGEKNADGEIVIDLAAAQECIQKKALQYDKKGDNHYDTVSAFIKSIRGTDPDAALFWLAKMLEAGEDPKFIARRLVISASEDIGNAEPRALLVATAAARAVEMIGLPEARINLAQATAFLASAPKSNAAIRGIEAAAQAVHNESNGVVPTHLRDSHFSGSEALKRGIDYKYPHDYPNHYVRQQYLPDDILGAIFYEPSDQGEEKHIKAYLDHIREQ